MLDGMRNNWRGTRNKRTAIGVWLGGTGRLGEVRERLWVRRSWGEARNKGEL